MPSYRIELRIKASESAEELSEIIDNFSMDMGFDVRQKKVTPVKRPGRPSKLSQRVNLWVEKRTKPFTSTKFQEFTGLTRSAAWRRLDRLVAAGVYKKKVGELGEMIYYRSDNPVSGE